MTKSRTKLLEQQVNSLLIDYDVCDYENFILPKSMHLCMIRVIDNTNTCGGGQQGVEEYMEDHMGNMKNNSLKCLREEREAGALGTQGVRGTGVNRNIRFTLDPKYPV